jgi:hypothetical protein
LNTPNQSASNPWHREPALLEAVVVWAIAAIVFVATASAFRPYSALVLNFGDTSAYMRIADAIRSWNFSGVQVKHFWGLPYAIALLSRLTGISSEVSILLISSIASLASLILAYRLWGGWIALLSSVLSFDWYQRSFLGGSEPLFVALLFASFVAIRKERWKLAALLASLATITRPLGIFLLVGIGIYLLVQRDWRNLAWSVPIALVIGFLYVLPLRIYLHDPLATVHSYGSTQNAAYPPLFGIPFRAIIVGTMRYPAPLTNLLLSFGWIFLVLAGNAAMLATGEFRAYARAHQPEAIFVALYSLSLYCYNLPAWARGSFARFAIPILPFVFLALSFWMSSDRLREGVRERMKDRRLLWGLAILCSTLSAASAIGIQNVIAELHHH